MASFSDSFKASLFDTAPDTFKRQALALFEYQARHNPVYRTYLQHLRKDSHRVTSLEQIPFLPIGFFKHHSVTTGTVPAEVVFESSGTTGQTPSRHYVHDPAFYLKVARTIFEKQYGSLTDWHILALLPSYLQRKGSSLVYMVDYFIRESQSSASGFFLHNAHELVEKLQKLQNSNRKTLLIGVTFALLDLAEQFPGLDLSQVTIMETGGMKGRRQELLREEVHGLLTRNFGVASIHSEYGMTELLSQAYSSGEGIFRLPSTMKILLRDVNDPFCINNSLRSGGINVIDLANVDSCAFIETQDLGAITGPDTFRVLGRFDHSDIRGCNLMVQ